VVRVHVRWAGEHGPDTCDPLCLSPAPVRPRCRGRHRRVFATTRSRLPKRKLRVLPLVCRDEFQYRRLPTIDRGQAALQGRDDLLRRSDAFAVRAHGLSDFGERTFLLDALPPFVKASHPKKFVLEVIDGLKAAGQDVNTWRLGEDVVAKTVCRHAVKANDELARPELENLLEDLRRCSMPYTCPHGRPTLIELNYRELEKKFGRSA